MEAGQNVENVRCDSESVIIEIESDDESVSSVVSSVVSSIEIENEIAVKDRSINSIPSKDTSFSIQQSSNVSFGGTQTHYHGPVTIKQFIYSKLYPREESSANENIPKITTKVTSEITPNDENSSAFIGIVFEKLAKAMSQFYEHFSDDMACMDSFRIIPRDEWGAR